MLLSVQCPADTSNVIRLMIWLLFYLLRVLSLFTNHKNCQQDALMPSKLSALTHFSLCYPCSTNFSA